jgi:hypothetical protein
MPRRAVQTVTDKWDAAADEATQQDQQDKTIVRLEELERSLLDSKGLREIPSPTPIIDGYLFRDSLAWMGGKPGHCKSFAAGEMACCVGTGRPGYGNAVKQGKVLYLIAEGASGFSDRIETWEMYNNADATGCTFLPVPIQFIKEVDVAAFGLLLAIGMTSSSSTPRPAYSRAERERRHRHGASS